MAVLIRRCEDIQVLVLAGDEIQVVVLAGEVRIFRELKIFGW